MAALAHLLDLVSPPFCWSCGAAARRDEPLCARCRLALRWLDPAPVALGGGPPAWAPLAYEGPARAVVAGLKYRGAPALAAPMAAAIAAAAPGALTGLAVTLVPVPLHPRRFRRRGFNQAERIAAALGRRTGLAVAEPLRRGGAASRQVGRGRSDRLVAGPRIEVARRPPPVCVLVDDVITTGSTIAACAHALRGAGADVRGALAYARTPGR